MKGDAMHAQFTGGPGDVAVGGLNRALEELAFLLCQQALDLFLAAAQIIQVRREAVQDSLQRVFGQTDPLRGNRKDVARQIAEVNGSIACQSNKSMNQIFQFPHVYRESRTFSNTLPVLFADFYRKPGHPFAESG